MSAAWRVLVVAALAVFMVSLDTTVLFVAFPSFRATFHDVSSASISWILNIYTIWYGALLVPTSRLADRFGRRRFFLAGIAVFVLASLLCGVAPSVPLLVSAPLESVTPNRAKWFGEAYRTRAELRGLDAAESAARAQANVARATYLPTVGAFANATYANPNPRYFPPEAAWHATWALGASVTWTPTDIPSARSRASEADARGDALVAQRNAVRDAWINARIDTRVARARLKHAAGRDQHAVAL
jgi:MFS family permease